MVYSEITRKLLHLATIGYVIGYNLISRELVIIISASIVMIEIIVETLRLKYKNLNRIIHSIGGVMLREKERGSVCGLPWTLTGVFFTIFLFENSKVINTVLLYLVFGDSAAAIAGKYLGKIKLGNKTLEGSIVCFLICFLAGLFFLKFDSALVGAAVATLVEFLPLPLNDNFWIPLTAGVFLSLLQM